MYSEIFETCPECNHRKPVADTCMNCGYRPLLSEREYFLLLLIVFLSVTGWGLFIHAAYTYFTS